MRLSGLMRQRIDLAMLTHHFLTFCQSGQTFDRYSVSLSYIPGRQVLIPTHSAVHAWKGFFQSGGGDFPWSFRRAEPPSLPLYLFPPSVRPSLLLRGIIFIRLPGFFRGSFLPF